MTARYRWLNTYGASVLRGGKRLANLEETKSIMKLEEGCSVYEEGKRDEMKYRI